MAALSAEATPPGDSSSFATPSEDVLVSFLRRKIAGEPLHAAAGAHFHEADIYALDPSMLATLFDPAPARRGGESGGAWFFFTRVRPKRSSDSRKSRQVGGGVGTWHSERAPRRVLDGDGNCAGHSQYFSYKLRTGKNCSERTDWYMLEFSQDQEADHDRVLHGGEPEPQLVLCKIYKAHTLNSRSGSGSASRPSCSASARKRKAVDEASASAPVKAPVKAKRRLFDSPAPASAISLQEQISSKGWIVGETDGEAATSQGKMSDISNWFPLMSESDGELATSLMSKSDGEVPTSQGKIGDASGCIALMSKAKSEAATPQLKIGDTSDFSRFWPEPEATGYSMTSGTLPTLGNCSTGGTLPTLGNCSRAIVRDVGDLYCGRDAWSSAFRRSDDTTAFVWGMPADPVLPPPGEASWWSGTGGHDVWSF